MIMRLKFVKRVRTKGRVYWYHTKTRQRLPDDPETRAARVLEINRSLTSRPVAVIMRGRFPQRS